MKLNYRQILIIGVFANFLFSIWSFGQAPEILKYQAVLHDASGSVLKDTNVDIEISILQGSSVGNPVYTETHSSTTNDFGLVNLNIGEGESVDGFSFIDWTDGPYYIKITVDGTEIGINQLLSVPYALHAKTAIETDPVFNTSVASGITETDTNEWNNKLDNYSETDPVFDASIASGITESDTTNWNNKLESYEETDPVYSSWDKDYDDLINRPTSISDFTLNANSQSITNLADPTNSGDAATKSYVDALLERIEELEALTTKLEDVEGNLYSTVKIGEQVWMAENLRTTKYNDNTDIPLVTDGTAWSNLTTPAYCWYDNDEASNKFIYGALYNTYVIDSGNVCPTGWHIPTYDELLTLISYVGGWDGGSVKLKEAGTTHWQSPNTGATNETGFIALPGGWRLITGSFNNLTNEGYFWTSTEYSSTSVYYMSLSYTHDDIIYGNYDKKAGMSIRCIKD